MKKILIFILFIVFTFPLYSSEVPLAADSTTSIEVFFAYDVTGYIGFSNNKVVSAAPVENESSLEITTNDNIQYRSDYIHVYWQIFTTQGVTIQITGCEPLKNSDETKTLYWKSSSDVTTDDGTYDDPIAIDSSKPPTPDKPLVIYKDEGTSASKPRIGSRELQVILPLTESAKIDTDVADIYSTTLTINMVANQ